MKRPSDALRFSLRMLPVLLAATAVMTWINYQAMEAMGQALPLSAVLLSMVLQCTVIPFFCCLGGQKLSEQLGLWRPLAFEKKPLILALAGGAILTTITVVLEFLIFLPMMPVVDQADAPTIALPLQIAMELLYGGVVEELMLRLLFLSLLAWILWKVFARSKDEAPEWTLSTANILAAVLFSAGHLPATLATFGTLNATLLLRCFLFNGAAGLFFGYLYRKYGLCYSIVSHMSFHLIKHLIIPIFI